MTTFTEGKHPGTHIAWEANSDFCRETGTVLSGEVMVAGTLLMLNGANKLVEHDGELDSADALETPVEGVLYEDIDATGGDQLGVVYSKRQTLLKDADLTYPEGAEDQCRASMAESGLIAK